MYARNLFLYIEIQNMCDSHLWWELLKFEYHQDDELSPLLFPLIQDLQGILNWWEPSEKFKNESKANIPYGELRNFLLWNNDIQGIHFIWDHIDLVFSRFIPEIPTLNIKDKVVIIKNILEILDGVVYRYSIWKNFPDAYRPLWIAKILFSAQYNIKFPSLQRRDWFNTQVNSLL